MSSTPQQSMVNQCFFEDKEIPAAAVTQMGFFTFPQSINSYPLPFGYPQSLKPFNIAADHHHALQNIGAAAANNLTQTLFSQKQRDDPAIEFGGPQLLSLPRSTANNFRANECLGSKKIRGEDHHHLGVSTMKMKRIKARKKVREPRFCFKTMSDVDVLDDGYKWRKYGQKVVKNTHHPRSYYRCTQDNCRVKKRVERLAEDPRMVITTYEGRHAHSPSTDDLDDSNHPHSHLNNFF